MLRTVLAVTAIAVGVTVLLRDPLDLENGAAIVRFLPATDYSITGLIPANLLGGS